MAFRERTSGLRFGGYSDEAKKLYICKIHCNSDLTPDIVEPLSFNRRAQAKNLAPIAVRQTHVVRRNQEARPHYTADSRIIHLIPRVISRRSGAPEKRDDLLQPLNLIRSQLPPLALPLPVPDFSILA